MFADIFANFAFCEQISTAAPHRMEVPPSRNTDLQLSYSAHGYDSFETKAPFESCTRSKSSARRGGIADRGQGSYCTSPTKRRKASSGSPCSPPYQSDAIIEESDSTCPSSPPLSPKTIALPRMRTRQRIERKRTGPYPRSPSTRRPSWRPNLKSEFVRRGSIDAIMALFNEQVWHHDADVETCFMSGRRRSSGPAGEGRTECAVMSNERMQQRRPSTLLHPSSPTLSPTASFIFFQAAPTSIQAHSQAAIMPTRRGSSLLHPSRPSSETLPDLLLLKTIINLPPKQQ